jgi:hypothetical protein
MTRNKNLFPAGAKRINLTVPLAMYDDILYVSGRLGVSASSLFYQMTRDSVHHMATVLREIPHGTDEETAVKRLRGDSVAYIDQQYSALMAVLDKELS